VRNAATLSLSKTGFARGNSMTENLKKTVSRRLAVQRRTGLSRSTIYAKMAEGDFPRPIKLGKRAVGWLDSDIDEWLESRPITFVEP